MTFRTGRQRRGNPNWGKAALINKNVAPAKPTQFELKVQELGLTANEVPTDGFLRRWAERNADRVYIPEELLHRWGIRVDSDLSVIGLRNGAL